MYKNVSMFKKGVKMFQHTTKKMYKKIVSTCI